MLEKISKSGGYLVCIEVHIAIWWWVDMLSALECVDDSNPLYSPLLPHTSLYRYPFNHPMMLMRMMSVGFDYLKDVKTNNEEDVVGIDDNYDWQVIHL